MRRPHRPWRPGTRGPREHKVSPSLFPISRPPNPGGGAEAAKSTREFWKHTLCPLPLCSSRSKPLAVRVPEAVQGAQPGRRPAADPPPAQRSRERAPHADARPTATPGAREPGNGGGLTPLASRRRPRTPGREPAQRAAASEQPSAQSVGDASPGVSRGAVTAVGSPAGEGMRCFWPCVRVRRAGPAPVAPSRGISPRRVGPGGGQCPARCAPGTSDGRESRPSGSRRCPCGEPRCRPPPRPGLSSHLRPPRPGPSAAFAQWNPGTFPSRCFK